MTTPSDTPNSNLLPVLNPTIDTSEVVITPEVISASSDPSSTLSELEAYDNSSLTDFRLCPRRYMFRSIMFLSPPKMNDAAEFGSSIHAGLYHYYRGDGEAAALKAAIFRSREETSDLKLRMTEAVDADKIEEYSTEFVIILLKLYMATHPIANEWWEVVEFNGDKYLEKGFAFEIPGCNGLGIGKFDMLVRDRQRPEDIYVVDHKTTTKLLNEAYWGTYNPNNQVSTYLAGLQELLGFPLKGFIVNALRVKDFKRGGADTKDKLFARYTTTRTQGQLHHHLQQMRYSIEEIQRAKAIGFHGFAMNAPGACHAFGRPCEYLPLCLAATEDTIQPIINSYRRSAWSPYEILGEAESKEVVLPGRKVVKL